MSALPPKADIVEHDRHVRFVPKADIAPDSTASNSLNSLFAKPQATVNHFGVASEYRE
jgi:hypothetical protein